MGNGQGNFGYQAVTGGGGGGTVTITQAPQTPNILDIAGASGNTLATYKSFTFVVRQGTIVVGGVTLGVGTYTYSNGAGTLGAISYDATGSNNSQLLFQI
jgi:hypothetical protein